MRALIADDDQTCCLLLTSMIKSYGESDMVADGDEVIRMFTKALVDKKPYDLICLDILMPGLDGQACLRAIRAIEDGFGIRGESGVKILMTTALDTHDSIMTAFRSQCEGYLVKPINREKFFAQLKDFGFTAS